MLKVKIVEIADPLESARRIANRLDRAISEIPDLRKASCMRKMSPIVNAILKREKTPDSLGEISSHAFVHTAELYSMDIKTWRDLWDSVGWTGFISLVTSLAPQIPQQAQYDCLVAAASYCVMLEDGIASPHLFHWRDRRDEPLSMTHPGFAEVESTFPQRVISLLHSANVVTGS